MFIFTHTILDRQPMAGYAAVADTIDELVETLKKDDILDEKGEIEEWLVGWSGEIEAGDAPNILCIVLIDEPYNTQIQLFNTNENKSVEVNG